MCISRWRIVSSSVCERWKVEGQSTLIKLQMVDKFQQGLELGKGLHLEKCCSGQIYCWCKVVVKTCQILVSEYLQAIGEGYPLCTAWPLIQVGFKGWLIDWLIDVVGSYDSYLVECYDKRKIGMNSFDQSDIVGRCNKAFIVPLTDQGTLSLP